MDDLAVVAAVDRIRFLATRKVAADRRRQQLIIPSRIGAPAIVSLGQQADVGGKLGQSIARQNEFGQRRQLQQGGGERAQVVVGQIQRTQRLQPSQIVQPTHRALALKFQIVLVRLLSVLHRSDYYIDTGSLSQVVLAKVQLGKKTFATHAEHLIGQTFQL